MQISISDLLGFIDLLSTSFALFLTQPVSNVSVLLTALSGFWAWREFQRTQPYAARFKSNIDLNFVTEINDHWIAELTLTLKNDGRYPIHVKDALFRVHGITATDAARQGAPTTLKDGITFSHLLHEGSFFAKRVHRHGQTILPGSSDEYTRALIIPNNILAVYLFGSVSPKRSFTLKENSIIFYTTNRIRRVPKNDEEILQLNGMHRLVPE